MTNRGYFARLHTLRNKLLTLINESKDQNTAILNIGCGYDTFILLSDQFNLDLANIAYFELD